METRNPMPLPQKASDFLGSRFLNAKDIGDRTLELLVDKVTVQEAMNKPGKKELVIHFAGAIKPLPLNASNIKAMIANFGEDANKWAGSRVTLKCDDTNFAGTACKGIRITATVPPK